jgi:hypothetical protein
LRRLSEGIEDGLKGLRETLEFDEPEERKALVREHIKEIRVFKNGKTLLETNPRGLIDTLGVCEFMVTPRGVEPNARLRGNKYQLAG